MLGQRHIAGEDIRAGDTIVVSPTDGKVYRDAPYSPGYIGSSAEQLREIFRATEPRAEWHFS